MRVLVVSGRMPAASGKGDQLRGFQFARALAIDHEVEVVTTGAGKQVAGAEERIASFAALRVLRTPLAARAVGAIGALLRGQPAQVGWMMPRHRWRIVQRRAAQADLVLAMSVRSLRGRLPVPVILDHVDAFSLNMRRRATGPERAPVRWLARIEAALLRRWERRLSGWVAAQLVTSPIDARELPPQPEVHVLGNSVEMPVTGGRPSGERDIDVILTGNMAYPPNADAAVWLSEAIAPALWRSRPQTAVWVVGRDAGRLALDARIQVRADVPEVAEYLRRAKLAVAPLRIGTGTPNKVLEAMAVGTPVVATPTAVEAFAFPPDCVVEAVVAEALATEICRLLEDDAAREQVARRAGAVVADYGATAQHDQLAAIVSAALAS
jgi:glycosyltransferase involved in cell wall biosynthesis